VGLTVLTLFLWVRQQAGSWAAWLTAGMFTLSPFTIEIAQFSRFYALQIFFFTLGAWCTCSALTDVLSAWRRALLAALTFIFFALAIWLQDTSLMGMVGVGLWVLGAVVHLTFFRPSRYRALKPLVVGVLITGALLFILAATLTDVLYDMWDTLRSAPLFGYANRDEFWFYHIRFLLLYPTLWSLVGLLAVLAMARAPAVASFAATVFAVGFLLASIGGPKATRYLGFAQPFLAIVWGIGLA